MHLYGVARVACLIALAVAACGEPSRVAVDDTPRTKLARVTPRADAAVDAGPPSCVDDGQPYDADALRERIAFLADKGLDGRVPGTRGDITARHYVADRFRCLGLVPGASATSYEQDFDVDGHTTANLVGLIRGSTDDVIVIGAHLDHVGHGKLGANDNASGVVSLLAIAQAMRQRDITPKRTLAFVVFGGEELGELGSNHFVETPPSSVALDHVVYDINLDMVGTYRSHGVVAAMGTFAKLPARAILDRLVERRTDRRFHVGLGGRGADSDHEPFCKLGIPYVFFWTPDASCYHATCDTIDNIDLPHLIAIAKLAGDLVAELAETDVDLKASRTRLGCTGR